MAKKSLCPIFILAVLFFYSSLTAETVNLSGTVSEASGDPIAGAEVKLRSDESIITTTGPEGEFTLTAELTSVLEKRMQSLIPCAALKGSVVNVNLTSASDIDIAVYSVSGRKVYGFNSGQLNRGLKKVPLPMNRLGSGVHIVTVHHQGYKSVFRFISANQRGNDFAGYNRNRDGGSLVLQKSASGQNDFVDTLVTESDGYAVNNYHLRDYVQDNIEITLSKSMYEVRFVSNGGNAINSQIVEHGDTAAIPDMPVREGYEFSGWYTDIILTELWSFSTPVSRAMILYAKWNTAGSGTGSWTVTDDTLTDPDGNTYTTVQIGNQVWIVENLRTTKYADGTPIPHVTDDSEWSELSTPAYCFYGNTTNQDSIAKFGALYNYYTVADTNSKSIAPEGWRVPTDEDWDTMATYLIENGFNWDGSIPEQPFELDVFDWEGNKIGKALASNGGEWGTDNVEGVVGNDQGSNNRTGFSALPGGSRVLNGNFVLVGNRGNWCSSTEYEYNASYAYNRNLDYDNEHVYRTYYDKRLGNSVRLVRDN